MRSTTLTARKDHHQDDPGEQTRPCICLQYRNSDPGGGDPESLDKVLLKSIKARTRAYGGTGIGLSIVKGDHGCAQPAVWRKELGEWC